MKGRRIANGHLGIGDGLGEGRSSRGGINDLVDRARTRANTSRQVVEISRWRDFQIDGMIGNIAGEQCQGMCGRVKAANPVVDEIRKQILAVEVWDE